MQRILIVTPHTLSHGESITAIHVAKDVARHGWEVSFVSSPNTAALIPPPFEAWTLGGDLQENQRVWSRAVERTRPNLVLFADYPLLAVEAGSVPLADEAWIERLERLDAALLTFDHLDLARERASRDADRLPCIPPPDRMGILLPCPIHDPCRQAGPKRAFFRYWTSVKPDSDRCCAVRARYLEEPGGLLVFHAVPRWAQALAAIMNHPLYEFMPNLLSSYLSDLAHSVTIVSVNDGSLLSSSSARGVTIVNLPSLPPNEFEDLLACSDLMLSENCFSVSVGKAVCSLVPTVLWRHTLDPVAVLTSQDVVVGNIAAEMLVRNTKSLDSWLAFPNWDSSLVSALNGMMDAPGGMMSAVRSLEIFGGVPTRRTVHALLTDEDEREICRAGQRVYLEKVSALPSPVQAIQRLTGCAVGRAA